jgi:hypothetical protein
MPGDDVIEYVERELRLLIAWWKAGKLKAGERTQAVLSRHQVL